jgi:hypothetical protein
MHFLSYEKSDHSAFLLERGGRFLLCHNLFLLLAAETRFGGWRLSFPVPFVLNRSREAI